ncbi:MAG TPA: hypothetical protein VF192_14485 [Longimicrobiales bacterium]
MLGLTLLVIAGLVLLAVLRPTARQRASAARAAWRHRPGRQVGQAA